MKALLDNEGYFTGDYAIIGDMEGSVEVESLPNETDETKLRCYKLQDEKWIFDGDKYGKLKEKETKIHILENNQKRILELKEELSASDYKIIKCQECLMSGEELPYDINELHAERQSKRDEINRLEWEIAR